MAIMKTSGEIRCAELDVTTRLLKERERTLQHLAQSSRCTGRPAAEQELGRVRAELASTYAQLRQCQPNSPAKLR